LAAQDGILEADFKATYEQLRRESEGWERQAKDLRRSVSQQSVRSVDAERVAARFRRMAEGIERFTFEDWRATIEDVDITGVVIRGEKRGEDEIKLQCRIPLSDDEPERGNTDTTSAYRDRERQGQGVVGRRQRRGTGGQGADHRGAPE
jgi:hypothetical protein